MWLRSKRVFLNLIANTCVMILQTVLALVVRKLFLVTIGSQILGLNSLYASILGLLSLSELGFGTAVGACLYKPLAEENHELISSYMMLLKKLYIIISISVFAMGIILIPFVHFFVSGDLSNPYIMGTFSLYLSSVAISYLYSYKKVLLEAEQRSYIINVIQIIYKIVLNVGYIIILYFTKNYYLYLCITIICNFLDNYLVSRICDKLYPYLKDECFTLDNEKKMKLFNKVKAMILYKIGNYLIDGTNNIIISLFIGTYVLAYYGNYYLIINILFAIFACLSTSSIAGFGNIIYSEKNKIKEIFSRLLLLQHFIYCFSTCAFVNLVSLFVNAFFGEKSVMPISVVLIMVSIFYIKGFSQAIDAVRGSMGLYEIDKWWNIIEAVLNIIISIILVKPLGIAGVLIGTVVAYGIRYIIILPIIVSKYIIPNIKNWYYQKLIIYALNMMAMLFLTFFICKHITIDNIIIDFLVKGCVSVFIPTVFNILVYAHTKEFKDLIDTVRNIFKRKKPCHKMLYREGEN